MVNKKLLLNLIKEKGLKQKFLAEKLGITYQAFNNKINNLSEFTVSEAYEIANLLDIRGSILECEIFLSNLDT